MVKPSIYCKSFIANILTMVFGVGLANAGGDRDVDPAGGKGQTSMWKVVVEIDCTAQPPDSQVGVTQVIKSDIGAYREAGTRIGDRFVYSFKLSSANRLVRATIIYPDDKMRTAGVSVWGPPQEALGSGFMCGEDIPLSERMVTREFVFFSEHEQSALVFSTEAPNQPVGVASVRIEESDMRLPPAAIPAVSAKNHRRIGLAWEDPVLARCFGEADSVNPEEFELVLQHCMDYCRWVGLTEICYPAYWYLGPMFGSRVVPNYPIATRLHPRDSLAQLAKSCEGNGIAYYPVLNIHKIRTLMGYMLDEKQVISGNPNINTVTADGRVRTWENSSVHLDCVSVPLHPVVQDACKNLLVEVATLCAPYESFAGVDLAMWPHSILKLGSSAPGDSPMSFDDYTVDAFCADLNLEPPGKPGDKDRFAARARWLSEDPARWHAWLKWRADRMTQYYSSLAEELASIKPGAKLGICIYIAHGRPENEDVDINEQIYASGIDLVALSKNPNITIKRYAHQMLPRWRLRNGMPRPKNLNVENTPEFQRPFANIPGMSFLVHQQYFETSVNVNGDALSLPQPFPSESEALQANAMIRVTEPLPSGRDYLRFFSSAIRNYDPYSMCVGGYVLGTQGAEPELREMAVAFSALPAVNFETVHESDQGVVRCATAEGRTWVYAVNLTAKPMIFEISIQGGEAVDAVTGHALAAADGRVKVQMQPYALVSLCGPTSLKVMSATGK